MGSHAADSHNDPDLLPGHSHMQAWRPLNSSSYGKMTPERSYTPLSARDPSHAWSYVGQTSTHGRISPSHNATPSLPASTMPSRSTSGDQWRGLHETDQVRRASMTSRIGDPPLTLHIPDQTATHLPRLASDYSGNSQETMLRPVVKDALSGLSPAPMALPSFASLREATLRDADVEAKSGLAFANDRLRCDTCSKVEPLVRDAVVAVAELHDAVQEHCSRSSQQRPAVPGDTSLRTFQWIIDNLRYAKSDLLEARRQTDRATDDRLPLASLDHATRKRPSELVDSLDIPLAKRYRAVSMDDAKRSLPSIQTFAHEQSSYAHQYSKETGRPGYSSPPSESLPASAYPRHPSPTFPSQWHQPPPSPMSLAYAPSAGPALTITSAQSSHSPTSPHHPSMLGPSTSSAASQHVADLQHQITVKSLSLQSLQTEYSAMLQKFQRERVKNQAIEKKANVAEQEINDLTTRNEDLADQVKSLETSLAESEKKRDAERADITKEREQWGRMLDMGGRLQAKNAIDRQRLSEQIARLEQRLQSCEQGSGAVGSGRQSPSSRTGPGASPPGAATSTSLVGFGLPQSTAIDQESTAHGFSVVAAQRENLTLKSRIDVLRFALEELSRQSLLLHAQERETVSARAKMDEAVQRALNEDDAMQRPRTGALAKARGKPAVASPPKLATISEPRSRSVSDAARRSGSSSVTDDLPSAEEMLRMRRVESPSAADLGVTEKAASASPEELVKALGPPPRSVPIPSYHPPPRIFNPASRNMMREPFGPSTPYPGTESAQWRVFAPSEQQNRSTPMISRRSSLSTDMTGPTASQAGSGTLQMTGHAEQSTLQASTHSVRSSIASMLPPPRPAATSAQLASWRPS